MIVLPERITDFNPSQSLNALLPSIVVLPDIFTDSKASELLNADSPILVKLLGNETDISFFSDSNALLPIVVTPSSIMILLIAFCMVEEFQGREIEPS